jgi:hypothetical protein
MERLMQSSRVRILRSLPESKRESLLAKEPVSSMKKYGRLPLHSSWIVHQLKSAEESARVDRIGTYRRFAAIMNRNWTSLLAADLVPCAIGPFHRFSLHPIGSRQALYAVLLNQH